MGLFTTLDFTPALKPWGWGRQTFDFLSQKKKKGETFAASVGVSEDKSERLEFWMLKIRLCQTFVELMSLRRLEITSL